ncbi:MAG: cohesin domain-containing protein [Anaerolineae bacterium]
MKWHNAISRRLSVVALILAATILFWPALTSAYAQNGETLPTPTPMHATLVATLADLESAIEALRVDDTEKAKGMLMTDDGVVPTIGKLQGRLEDLYPIKGVLLGELAHSLEEAIDSGRQADSLALARAVYSTLFDLLPGLEAYERHPTYIAVTSGEVRPGAELTVPLVIGHVPADGFAAYEVHVSFDSAVLRADEVSGSLGQGATNLDNERGIVGISGFDVQRLLKLGPGAPATQSLAQIRFTAIGEAGDTSALAINGPALFAADGEIMPVQGLDGRITLATEATSQSGGVIVFLRYLGVLAILLVSGAALLLLRRAAGGGI